MYVGNVGIYSPPLYFSLKFTFVYVIRPEALATLLSRQTDFFHMGNEVRIEIDSSVGDERVLLLASDAKVEVGNGDQRGNSEEPRPDQKEEEEEAKNNKEEEKEQIIMDTKLHQNEAEAENKIVQTEEEVKKINEEEELMDNNISRRDPVIGTEEEGGRLAKSPLPPAARKLLCLVAVIVGLVVTWYSRKVQRKRRGWHKKIDATFSPAWYTTPQGWALPGPVGHED